MNTLKINITTKIPRRWSRNSVSIQNSSQYIFYRGDVNTIKKELYEYKGAYATNSLYVYFNKPEYDEDSVRQFIKEFKSSCNRYYNLKTLCIDAPFSIFDGEMLEDIITVDSSYTNLYMHMFSVIKPKQIRHTSVTKNKSFENLSVYITDGMAYPNSGNDFLDSISELDTIKNIVMTNHSPHEPSLKRKYNVKYTTGFKIRGWWSK